jgi:erythromycin esterase-like protein
MNVVLIGESIHGVAEFTEFKHRWLRENARSRLVVVFEADHVGMLLSAHDKSQETHILRNFPKVHRTEEMLLLIRHILQKDIPFYGADLVTRNKTATYSGHFKLLRDKQIASETKVYSESPPLFQLRDEYMSDVVASAAMTHPGHTVVGFFHNMHIKHNGSLEKDHLRLTSIAENLRHNHDILARSIGLFASSGTAVCNDLSPFSFDISDPDVIEHLAHKTNRVTKIVTPQLMEDLTAYHHASERESISVNRQYDECVVFPTVRPPRLLS